MNINLAKLRRIEHEAEDANAALRGLADRAREAVEHRSFCYSEVYRRPVLLEVDLESFLSWEKEDLAKAAVNLNEVRAAIAARDDAAELQIRLAAARAIAAPKLKLAARLRDWARPQGHFA